MQFDVTDVDEDSLLMPPPRRSTRIRRQTTIPTPQQNWPDNPIKINCKNTLHNGVFCAAVSASHTPRYYNSLKPVCFSKQFFTKRNYHYLFVIFFIYIKYGDATQYHCPFCFALLLKKEATGANAFSKCCAKGKVKMARQFYLLQV